MTCDTSAPWGGWKRFGGWKKLRDSLQKDIRFYCFVSLSMQTFMSTSISLVRLIWNLCMLGRLSTGDEMVIQSWGGFFFVFKVHSKLRNINWNEWTSPYGSRKGFLFELSRFVFLVFWSLCAGFYRLLNVKGGL